MFTGNTPILESLFNKVADPEDCCKTCLLHALLCYVHRGIVRTKLNIYDGAFFTLVKPYFKNVLDLIILPLGSIFYTTYSKKHSKLYTTYSKKH